MDFSHNTVLLRETVGLLHIKKNGTYIDCTLGGGGHSRLICENLDKDGTLIGIDQDTDALKKCENEFSSFPAKIIFVHENFKNIKKLLNDLNILSIDGAVMDLGVSSHQLDSIERGFSYMQNSPLDMRMNTQSPLTAYKIVNEYTEREIAHIIHNYGEERFAKKIAAYIVRAREKEPVITTGQLSDIIKSAIPAANRREGPHPARRCFQAIRIAVNDELNILENAIDDIFETLSVGGRIAIITFHSLEDRIVKNTFNKHAVGCTCPPKFPICVCGKKSKGELVVKKPITPSNEEINENPRSRSAKLRIIEKL